jgi:hypothetical protein
MDLIFRERPNSRESTENPRSLTMRYSVRGTADNNLVRAYADDNTPWMRDNLYKQDVRVTPDGHLHWNVDVPYGPEATKKPATADQLEYSWQVDTTGGTTRITTALEHIKDYAAKGVKPPNHKGAINVTPHGVEGCEIVVPQFKWTETHQFLASRVRWSYTAILENLTGTINAYPFRGRERGAIRFDGASGGASSKDPAIVEFTYHFVADRYVKGRTIGDITGIDKPAWAYGWEEHEQDEQDDGDGATLVTPPKAVHIERVYEYGNFRLLGIGS